MKIIDIHTHILPADPHMDGYVRAMDRHEVEAALVMGTPKQVKVRGNEAVARVVRRHTGRLYGGVHVDLREPVRHSIRLVREYADQGFKCVKFFPNLGFDANDEKYEPFWQVVEDLGLLALTHCGWLVHDPERAKIRVSSLTATPFHFEVPARRHQKINFVFAHFGGGASYLETVVLLSRLPNCYADTTPGWGTWIWQNRMPGIQGLSRDKVLYGTDCAGDQYAESIRAQTKMMRDNGYRTPELKKFFHDNAKRLLKI
jgi:predicted TIM-barrel fold metal-dependent hydrolase